MRRREALDAHQWVLFGRDGGRRRGFCLRAFSRRFFDLMDLDAFDGFFIGVVDNQQTAVRVQFFADGGNVSKSLLNEGPLIVFCSSSSRSTSKTSLIFRTSVRPLARILSFPIRLMSSSVMSVSSKISPTTSSSRSSVATNPMTPPNSFTTMAMCRFSFWNCLNKSSAGLAPGMNSGGRASSLRVLL